MTFNTVNKTIRYYQNRSEAIKELKKLIESGILCFQNIKGKTVCIPKNFNGLQYKRSYEYNDFNDFYHKFYYTPSGSENPCRDMVEYYFYYDLSDKLFDPNTSTHVYVKVGIRS